jgi:hypothetical protein
LKAFLLSRFLSSPLCRHHGQQIFFDFQLDITLLSPPSFDGLLNSDATMIFFAFDSFLSS